MKLLIFVAVMALALSEDVRSLDETRSLQNAALLCAQNMGELAILGQVCEWDATWGYNLRILFDLDITMCFSGDNPLLTSEGYFFSTNNNHEKAGVLPNNALVCE